MNHTIAADVHAVQSIAAVPTMMRVIAETTGLRWICVSRVTPDAWTMCAVRDQLGLGYVPGDQINIVDTFCDIVRRNNHAIVIDSVMLDAVYAQHHVPKMYGFDSYFAIPVYRNDGSFFGTLCGLDPLPARLTTPATLDMLKLFAELLSGQIDTELQLSDARLALRAEQETAELREQFIAVLGHDLRTPLSSILSGSEMIGVLSSDDRVRDVAARITRSSLRIASLIDDVMDFTRGKMGGALPVVRQPEPGLAATLQHVVAELRGAHAGRLIEADIVLPATVVCDGRRVAQLLSNLLLNAIVHGSAGTPVTVRAHCIDGRFTLSVSNAGAPIAPETAARLFQPFWRGDGAGAASGLGLGLYIASEIARSHDGTLAVDCHDGQTRFSFSFDT